MAVVYVGNYDNSPVDNCEPPCTMNPRDFAKHYETISKNCFSNHPDFVRNYFLHNVFVVGRKNIKSLDQHPLFDKWKDEMDAGEMWSLFGDKWVDDTA